MARTSFVGYLRQYGGPSKRNNTPGVMLSCIQFSFDVAQASTGTGKFLPIGAIPLFIQSLDGNAAADNATVDIGTAADDDGFGNELIAGVPGTLIGATVTTAGALLNIELTAATEIFGGVGGTAGTGISSFGIYYIMNDDGSDGA